MKSITSALLLLALCAGSAARAQQHYTITGRINNIPNPQYLCVAANWRELEVQDSVPVVNGRFVYRGILAEPDPTLAFIFVGFRDTAHGGRYIKKMVGDCYLEKGTVKLDINGLAFRDSMHFSGTPTNVDYRMLVTQKNVFTSYMVKYLDSLGTAQVPKENRVQLSREKWAAFYSGFVKAHPASFLSLQLLGADLLRVETPEQIRNLLLTLSSKMQQTLSGIALRKQLDNTLKIRVGIAAPDFTEKDTLNNPVALSSFRGKYVLVDFWASWCHPCRAESPYLRDAYDAYKDSNFTILSVSMDNSKNAWLKAVHDDKLSWQQLSALNPLTSESANKYGIKAIPRNFLIDPTGKIIAMDLRGKDILEKLKEVL
ncbi:peroxiredoxin [Filimonas zeae]|uniref:Thiol:disulfide interchange protein n=1 Tax=Filimonas zeae TaxID=1737353 RepID=A0A917IV72_9BACT|nr:TlpA disulfide reductase family protein [Filimonas zeae]MDR6339447.1 peroxiredoxin [Filimonas zeae]GGH63559.1 thiol:disulfide interchange protein [Filimonas zeae]